MASTENKNMNHDPRSVEDRREHCRFQMLEFARMNIDGQDETASVVTDISLGGLQVRSRNQYASGAIVDVSIGRGDLEPIRMKAEIRYSLPVKKSDLFATGLKFVGDKDAPDTKVWVEYVHQIFREQGEELV